jgi:hypothetical protein
MNSRFPILSTLSKVIKGFGVVCFGVGLILIFGADEITYKIFGFIALVIALLLLAFSEIIGVAFAIEDNTKKLQIACLI